MRSLIPMEILEKAADVMRVLAHPHRLRICELLADGDVSVGELAERMGLGQNVVSQHLMILRSHGILDRRREGKAVYYCVVHPGAGWMLSCIRKHAGSDSR